MNGSSRKNEYLVLGGGCFWCLEAAYKRLEGVVTVQSGYAGGAYPDPDYNAVCSGMTGHAEVVKITYDPEMISLETLLEFFWKVHDPTTLNRQGADAGTQYRSVILYANDEQKTAVRESLKKLEKSGIYSDPVVTEISKLQNFYPAESYHDDYYDRNRQQGYCRIVIAPKLKKLGLD